ncbi:hypothetical protein NOVOSPHI9U_310024 [Novosphingobium sp. 9U]|nr:hypothetical protein NOVOSPHI9U_310024 [Novosphingobium sp. 9U]
MQIVPQTWWGAISLRPTGALYFEPMSFCEDNAAAPLLTYIYPRTHERRSTSRAANDLGGRATHRLRSQSNKLRPKLRNERAGQTATNDLRDW